MKTVELYKFKEINGKWQEYWVRRLTFEPYEYTPANVAYLGEKIKELHQKYKPSHYRKKLVPSKDKNPMYGFCYPATQALFYLFDTDQLIPMRGVDYRNEYHWWLQEGENIIDITADQYYNVGETPPYGNGKKGQWYAWKKQPSMSSLNIIASVHPNVNDESVYIYKDDHIHHNPLFS